MKTIFYHFLYLHTAYKLNDTQTFLDYVMWLNSVLVSRGLKTDMIIYNFEKIQENMVGMLDKDIEVSFLSYLDEGIRVLKEYKQNSESV